MRAAIYARYSTESQRKESIADQISACKRFALARGISVVPGNIFSDQAISGSMHERPGLTALKEAAKQHLFDAVLVDDLSRLARDNLLMLSMISALQYEGVRIISVADGLDSENEEAKLGIQIRGIFNELHLRDLRNKTLRGQIGQKQRGFSAGDGAFGYHSVPTGEMIRNVKGIERPEGWKQVVDDAQAAVVLRAFRLYADGNSLTEIAKIFNREKIRGRHSSHETRPCWRPTTIRYMLENEKYLGRWVWNKMGTRKDPRTGRKRAYAKPESEWVSRTDETLRIVPEDLWKKVQERRRVCARLWPEKRASRGFSSKRGSHMKYHATHVLAGLLVCSECKVALAQVSGKDGGYLGCPRAQRGGCDNRVLVRRTKAERIIFEQLGSCLVEGDKLNTLLRKVAAALPKLTGQVMGRIKEKSACLANEVVRRDNFVKFVAAGNHSRAVADGLRECELRIEQLQSEIKELERANRAPSLPSKDWLASRLANLSTLLQKRTATSAEVLRQLLGEMMMKPVRPAEGRPYYLASSSIPIMRALDILDSSQLGSRSSKVYERRPRQDSNL